jgi:hypothetical protein
MTKGTGLFTTRLCLCVSQSPVEVDFSGSGVGKLSVRPAVESSTPEKTTPRSQRRVGRCEASNCHLFESFARHCSSLSLNCLRFLWEHLPIRERVRLLRPLESPLLEAVGGVSGMGDQVGFELADLAGETPLAAGVERHARQGRESLGARS